MLDYVRTLDGWLANMRRWRAELEQLVGAEDYRRFRTYLKVSRKSHSGDSMRLDLVLGRLPSA